MAKITKQEAETLLCQILSPSIYTTQYIQKVTEGKEKLTQAQSTIRTAITNGENKNLTSIDDLKEAGYDISQQHSEENSILENLWLDIKNDEIPIGWDLDYIIGFDSSNSITKHNSFVLYLKPKKGEAGNIYQAHLIGKSTEQEGNNRFLVDISNPGDSTEDNLTSAIIEPSVKEQDSDTSTVIINQNGDGTATISYQFENDADRRKNDEMAKLHPERVVNGIYYANDQKLAEAKKAQEELAKIDIAKGTEEGTQSTNRLTAALKAINTTLYGEGNEELMNQLSGSINSIETNAVLGSALSVRDRQKLLDFKKFKTDYKQPNSGKPPQNTDPFPVDSKIEELETHQPTVKVHSIVSHIHGKEAAVMGIMQLDAAEKRIVRLENNMATLMRYLYRLGSRVVINCQYYGGQSTFEKYKCIRCMKDDRGSEGHLTQIDECMCCTRYEPIYGQIYEMALAISA